ncbi:TPA: tRNA (adenosine(37)-N6)-threonylcarbamoyltransferase complex dimerization subunit type 1 TsaB [Candidatus Bipolaricaulota bacterium]|nr:tRNA (adenosine(37)-N6)-threonylcarbamoyltransferase complex dimerization subunit type 1 TsaB [Candidatus Bipolaricaulota bacterium]
MNVLAIETATDRGGVALLTRDGHVFTSTFHAPRQHGELLSGCVQAVLQMSGLSSEDLELIAVDVGPGSFTGLRIGIAFATALGQARQLPLVGVRQTDALGLPAAAWWPGQVAVWIHDRRDFVYHAWATRGRVGRASVVKVSQALSRLRDKEGVLVVGSGAQAFRDLLAKEGLLVPGEGMNFPDPVEIARLGIEIYGRRGADRALEPVYLQPPLASEKEA